MELDWSTFLLEVLNFLVLVWILQHFLYRPVLEAIQRRKQSIEKQLGDAAQQKETAENLSQQYTHRLEDWQKEKEDARQSLQTEINTERKRLLDNLHKELDSERQKQAMLDQRQQETLKKQLEKQAASQGAAFVTRLLERLASPELEATIIDMLVDDLQNLPEESLNDIRTAANKADSTLVVTSAYDIVESRRNSLQDTLTAIMGRTLSCEFNTDQRVVAGARVSIGAWNVQATLRDELSAFAEATNAFN